MAYTDRIAGDDYNRVADVDGRMLFGKLYTGTFQYARSFDRHVRRGFARRRSGMRRSTGTAASSDFAIH